MSDNEEDCELVDALHDPLDPAWEFSTPDVDTFHAHLDECIQCRDHPFALCSMGYKLVRKALNEAVGISNTQGATVH